jgi:hypothetical protein
MKKTSFNFGRAVALALCAAAFVFIGCEDIFKSDEEIIPVKTVSVEDAAKFLEAVNNAQIETIKIENGFDVDDPVTVSSKKTLVIPSGVTLAVKSITANADVYVSPDAPEEASENLGLLLSDTGAVEAGALLVKEKFVIAEGVNFTLNEGGHLVFADENIEAQIDGALKVPDKDSVYHNGDKDKALVLGGSGTVKVGSDEPRAIAESEDGFSVEAKPVNDEENEENEGEGGEEGEGEGEGDDEEGEGEEHLPAIDWNVQLLKVEADGETEVDGTYEENLNSVLAWINENGGTGDEYIIRLAEDQTMDFYNFPTGTDKAGIKITLEGSGTERTIKWSHVDTRESLKEQGKSGALFYVQNEGVLTLGNNITLDGENEMRLPTYRVAGGSAQDGACGMIQVNGNNSKLVMKSGSMITKNKAFEHKLGVPVSLYGGGGFVMDGGKITGNICYDNADGKTISTIDNTYAVYIDGADSIFVMNEGAEITNNTNSTGVYMATSNDGMFTMNGGTISNNGDWGVYIGVNLEKSAFTMNGGTIDSGDSGGAVYVGKNTFTMNGGTITGNSGDKKGLYLSVGAVFIINGTVTIGVPVQCISGPTSVSTIYIGSGFSSGNVIQIDLVGAASVIATKGWGSDAGMPFLKGGTPASVTNTINNDIFSKFAGRKVYTTDTVPVEQEGSITMSLNDGWGYAKFTAAQ